MKLAALLAIVGVMLGGCAQQPLWPTQDVQERAADDGAPPSRPEGQSPATRETRPPRDAIEAARQPPPAPDSLRAPLLAAGITAYDDGKYPEAAKALRAALKTPLNQSDQLAAHKYLAFIECSTGRRSACREEFRRALRIDPSFELEPAEAGHPVWGPIFRGLKPKPKR